MSEILVIAEHRRHELRPVTLELIGAAPGLKRTQQDKVTVVLIGTHPENFVPNVSVSGVDEVVTVKVTVPEFDPEIYEEVTRSLIETRRPGLVLLPHSVDSMGYAAALAAKGHYGLATDVFKLEYQGSDLVATRGGYGQKVHVEVDFPGKDVVVIALRANVFKPAEGAMSPPVMTFAAPACQSRSKNLDFLEMSAADDVDITNADFVLSIGRGIGEEANVEQFKELADTLGATLCCSRPIADSGWLPKTRQVGQSGKIASSCKLYIAMGISGAIQHLAGMKHVKTIVAVNTDPEASIFSVAKYGIVGDIFKIAEELRTHFAQ
jgi:electron transfer flavoprotein alpha subunit